MKAIPEINYDYCKACGICIAMCPKQVFAKEQGGKPAVEKPEECIGCMMCEYRCPDFALRVRREKNG